jgi:hypothetical protein
VSLQTPPPWFFPFPSLWHTFEIFRAEADLHVFVGVIVHDQLWGHPQIPPYLAHAGIQLAKSIEAMLGRELGHY